MFKVFGVGEVLWDLLPTGRQMGGAPANFAYHARALGADARVISRVGSDALGEEIIQHLRELNVPTDGISVDPTHPTGTVAVELDSHGQPGFVIHENAAWDFLVPEAVPPAALVETDAICFGSLAQRGEPSRGTIQRLVATAPRHAIRVFDVNLRQQFYSRELIETSLVLANVLKLNDAELPVLAGFFGLPGTPRQQMEALLCRFQLRLVACTRGAHGSLLFDGTRWCEESGRPTEVKDTVGAGDAFTAAITLGLLAGWDIEDLSKIANDVAAYVCSQAGATPPLPNALRGLFSPAATRSTTADPSDVAGERSHSISV
jgi:fructokinase